MIILENEIKEVGLNGLFKSKPCKANDRRKKCGGQGTKVGNFLRKAKTIVPAVASFIPIIGGGVGKVAEKLLNKTPKLANTVSKIKNTVGKIKQSQIGKSLHSDIIKPLRANVVANLTPEQKSTISAVTGVDITNDNVFAPIVTTPSAPSSPPIVADNDGGIEPINENNDTGAEPVITGDEVNKNLTNAQAKTIAQIKGVNVEQVKKETEPKTETTKNNMPLILGGIAVVAIGAYALSQRKNN